MEKINFYKMEYKKQMNDLRKKIDKIDRDIVHLLGKRMNIAGKLKEIKIKNKLAIRNVKRENEIMDNLFKVSNLNKKFIKEIFNKIFEESRRIQR